MAEPVDIIEEKPSSFICGVVEGFYGRPWTTEQRKDLFTKMKKWGMNAYVYAPKDDYKHRAAWRELYTVEEAEHLTGLITAAKEQGINFYYAISPGLDITYSSPKEVGILKRKLEQVSQFGCSAFALLFDDIEPEMSEGDKEVFQSFAHAQVSVTNEMYQHLGQPSFLVCPTQYCAARANPNVTNSEYLNTLGSKLPSQVEIMWTGSKVISRTLSPDSIDEISEVLRRPPVIWDNLHANDYDQKRIFLGPYSGRSSDLIPKVNGILTNPNCEYGANFVAIHTLAQWSRCNVDAIRDPSINDALSADIKLETEGCSEEGPCDLAENIYHPRRALKNAINEWLPEFFKSKPAWGPIAKPQPIIPVPVPIIPSVNTCMSLTTTVTSSTMVTSTILTSSCLPSAPKSATTAESSTVHSQLHALADVCCTLSTSVMNSLASETKVLPLDVKKTCKISNMEPMDCNMTPGNSPAHTAIPTPPEDAMADSPVAGKCNSNTMLVEVVSDDTGSSANMNVDSSNNSMTDEHPDSENNLIDTPNKSELDLRYEDVSLLCDLFYLPFEHGSLGLHLLTEFYWLRTNANVLKARNKETVCTPEVEEWLTRAVTFAQMAGSVNQLFIRLNGVANRELLYEIYPYVWDIRNIVSLLNSFVQWLAVCDTSSTSELLSTGQFTWFSKGWKEAFMSGDQEPWAFRGGLTADLQRLLPIESITDLFVYKAPEVPTSKIYSVRPYKQSDRDQVYQLVSRKTNFTNVPHLPGDMEVGLYLDASQDICFVLLDETEVVGYALAFKDVKEFFKKKESHWLSLTTKYSMENGDGSDSFKDFWHSIKDTTLSPEPVAQHYPAIMTAYVSPTSSDESSSKTLLACLLAALRAYGCPGVHTVLSKTDRFSIDFFSKLGFVEVSPAAPTNNSSMLFMGRTL